MIRCMKLTVVIIAMVVLLISQSTGAQPPSQFAKHEKIRLAWQQWNHFIDAGFTYDQLMENLSRINVNIWVDMGVVDKQRATLAHKHGMKYFGCGFLSMNHKNLRLAVDKSGLTCPQQWEALQDRPEDERPFGGHGYGGPSYVACPLNPKPWQDVYFKPILQAVKEGWCDGMFVDIEPYGAYRFFKYGDMLCYCDYCFGKYAEEHSKTGVDINTPYAQRYSWLREHGFLDGYLHSLGMRLETLLRKEAEQIWAIDPDFRFSLYPDYTFNPRRDWMMMAVARGLNSDRAPFLLVASTNYWEDRDRPWWEQPHEWYRKQGIQYIMGSWDGGMLGANPESEISGDQLMYEMAMASDGYWRWGMRAWNNQEWNAFALTNQRLRQVESKLGDFLMQGQRTHHFTTVAEQSGDPDLWRRIVTRTYKHKGKYLTRIFNGNSDQSIRVRLRFPRLTGGRQWKVHDPIHQIQYIRADSTPSWTAKDLTGGLVVVIPRRGELFLQIEPSPNNTPLNNHQLIHSLEVPTITAPPALTSPLPDVSEPLSDNQFVYLSNNATKLNVADAEKSSLHTATQARWAQLLQENKLTGEEIGALTKKQTEEYKPKIIFPVMPVDNDALSLYPGPVTKDLKPEFIRQPALSPDRKIAAVAVWVNGKSQIYLVNTDGSGARNISNNTYSDHSPQFSPDGRKIIFSSDRNADWEIYTMHADGTNPRRLTKSAGVDRSPTYSPDGKQIAFISDRQGDFDVYLMNTNGTNQHALFPRGGHEYEPTWSPDGSLVACTARVRHLRCIQISRRDGMDSYYLACGPATGMHSISFSSNGQKLAAIYRNFGRAGLMVVNLDAEVDSQFEDWKGKQVHFVRETEREQPRSDNWYRNGENSPRAINRIFSTVNFSPSGEKLLYCSDEGPGNLFQFYTIPITGGEPQSIGIHPAQGTKTVWNTQ